MVLRAVLEQVAARVPRKTRRVVIGFGSIWEELIVGVQLGRSPVTMDGVNTTVEN